MGASLLVLKKLVSRLKFFVFTRPFSHGCKFIVFTRTLSHGLKVFVWSTTQGTYFKGSKSSLGPHGPYLEVPRNLPYLKEVIRSTSP